MSTPFLSIVIPAFNEEARILLTLHQVTAYLSRQGYVWEVVVANDGSNDATAALVEEIARTQTRVSLLNLPHRGKGGAVRAGMLHARGKYRFLCDADLSMPIEQIEQFLPPRLDHYEIALGSREAPGARRINEPRLRHLMGRVFNWVTRFLAVRGLRDTQCGFKCFHGEAAEFLFLHQKTNGFGFDAEVLFLSQRMGMRLVEVPIDWYYMNQSKVRPFRDSLDMVTDILAVRWRAFRGRYGKLGPLSRGRADSKRDR